MKTRFFVYLLTVLVLVSFASAGQVFAKDSGMGGKLAAPAEGERYLRMANNFFIIYDAGTTMDVPYKDTGLTRMEAEKQILQKSNMTLPDLGWQAGLYPHWKGGLWLHGAWKGFKPYYELKRYEQASYGDAIDQLPVKPTGPPMIQRGFMKLEKMLDLSGRTEVFIFSDGLHSTEPELEPYPLDIAKKLAAKHDVCFTIVSSATTEEGIKLLDDIAGVNACSQIMDFDVVFENPEHLFGKLYMDTDALGFNNVLFDFDKSNIKTEFKLGLNKLGQFLIDNPASYVVLSGFCDNKGTEEYNIKLSKKRAESVRNYLMRRYGIDGERIQHYWYGYANPVASNATPKGRALNRRVTIAVRLQK